MKFNEICSKGSGDMERTGKCYRQNGRLAQTGVGHSYNPLFALGLGIN